MRCKKIGKARVRDESGRYEVEIIIYKDGALYVGQNEDLLLATSGRNREELMYNYREALTLYVEDAEEDGVTEVIDKYRI